MSKPKFILGPWFTDVQLKKIYPDAYACSNQVYDKDGMLIAACMKIDSCEFDAALIAAAPDMYEMLERILDFKTGGPFISTNPSVKEIASLLKKARGEA